MNEADLIIFAFVLIFGLCIGSFLNVVALRGLSGESIVLPPSKCPNCHNKLKWWMNIPVLSWIILRGKCGFCKSPVSIQYPLIELLTGILFLLIFLKFDFSYETIFFFIASSLLIVMSVCDIKESVILDYHAYILIVFGIFYNLTMNGFEGCIFAAIGAVCGFIIYEILARSGYLLAGQRAFGEGDSLIAGGIGAFFGWKFIILSTMISILVMAVFTLPYFFVHSYKAGKKRTCLGLVVSFFVIILAAIVSKLHIFNSLLAVMIYLLAIISSIIWSVVQILSDMNKKTEEGEANLCMLPFGPSMAISFLIIMFFKENIMALIPVIA